MRKSLKEIERKLNKKMEKPLPNKKKDVVFKIATKEERIFLKKKRGKRER